LQGKKKSRNGVRMVALDEAEICRLYEMPWRSSLRERERARDRATESERERESKR